jgi:hypothetical protein
LWRNPRIRFYLLENIAQTVPFRYHEKSWPANPPAKKEGAVIFDREAMNRFPPDFVRFLTEIHLPPE